MNRTSTVVAIGVVGALESSPDRFGERTAIALGVGVQAVVLFQRQRHRDGDGHVVGIDTRASDPFHGGRV